MNSVELREKRAKLWEGTKAFLDSHRMENGLLSAEDDAAYDRMETEIVALGKEIERAERAEAMDRELAKAVNTPIVDKPSNAPKIEKGGRANDEYSRTNSSMPFRRERMLKGDSLFLMSLKEHSSRRLKRRTSSERLQRLSELTLEQEPFP